MVDVSQVWHSQENLIHLLRTHLARRPHMQARDVSDVYRQAYRPGYRLVGWIDV